MQPETIRALNAINRAFYVQTADAFDESRNHLWPGWLRLAQHLPVISPEHAPNVLDLACGNGRFGLFLRDHWCTTLSYTGVDSSSALLDHARETLQGLPDLHLLSGDLVEARDALNAQLRPISYDVVALLGVLHHIPGLTTRIDLLRWAAHLVRPGGVLVFTAWCFDQQERFRAKYRAFPASLITDLEDGDHLMDWQRGFEQGSALRYCHYIDPIEHDQLVVACTEAGLTEIVRYSADSRTADGNRYSLLQR